MTPGRKPKTRFTMAEVGMLLEDLRSEFHTFGDRLLSLSDRADVIQAEVARHTEQLNTIDLRLTSVESRLTNVESRLTNVESRLSNVEETLTAMADWLRQTNLEQRVNSLEQKVSILEQR